MRILLVGAGGVGTALARIAAGLLAEHRCDVLMNATDPRFVMPLFRAALQAGTHYLDIAMSLSYPIPASRTAGPASSSAVALELIDAGAWSGAGLLGPEALPPRPFLGPAERLRFALGHRRVHPRLNPGPASLLAPDGG